MNEYYFIVAIITTITLLVLPHAKITWGHKVFNSSSFYSRQRDSVQYPILEFFFVQGVGVCQAIAVIHSRIMEESPNSIPNRFNE
jgi:hypothetical protein